MVIAILKNHLCAARTNLGLTQREVARILGMKSPARICALENGQALPTVEDCVAFQVLFKRSFEELWPRFNLETEAFTDRNIRSLIEHLERGRIRTARRRARGKVIARKLAVVVDGFPEDIANVI